MANRRTIARLSMPLAALTLGISLTACNGMPGTSTKTVTESATSAKENADSNASDAASENSDPGNSENSDSDKSDEATSNSDDSPSDDSSNSSDSSSDESSDSSSESSSDSSSEPSDSESSSSSEKPEVSNSEFQEKARNNEVAACQITDVDFIRGGARYCAVDKSSVTAKYRGQSLYVTYATRIKADHKYSGRLSVDGESHTTTFNNNLTSDSAGSLYVSVPMRKSGTYKFEFLEDGKVVKTKSVDVSVD